MSNKGHDVQQTDRKNPSSGDEAGRRAGLENEADKNIDKARDDAKRSQEHEHREMPGSAADPKAHDV